MILTTQRLSLRLAASSDAAALFAILGDPKAMAHWDREPLPRLATVEAQLADELAAMAAGGFFCWTVLEGGDAIGSVDLSAIAGGHAVLGFAFRRDRWGQGLAREALEAVTAEAFEAWGLTQLTAAIQIANQRAQRLLEALGFHKDGALPDVVRDGVPRARALYVRQRSATKKGA